MRSKIRMRMRRRRRMAVICLRMVDFNSMIMMRRMMMTRILTVVRRNMFLLSFLSAKMKKKD